MSRFPTEPEGRGRFFRPPEQRPRYPNRHTASQADGRIDSHQGRFPPPPRHFEPLDHGPSRFWQPSFRHRPPLNRFPHGNNQPPTPRAGPPEHEPRNQFRSSQNDSRTVGRENQSRPFSPSRRSSAPAGKVPDMKNPEDRLTEERRRSKSNGVWRETFRLLSIVDKENPAGIGAVDKIRMLSGSTISENSLRSDVESLHKTCEQLQAVEDRLAEEEEQLTKKLEQLTNVAEHCEKPAPETS